MWRWTVCLVWSTLKMDEHLPSRPQTCFSSQFSLFHSSPFLITCSFFIACSKVTSLGFYQYRFACKILESFLQWGLIHFSWISNKFFKVFGGNQTNPWSHDAECSAAKCLERGRIWLLISLLLSPVRILDKNSWPTVALFYYQVRVIIYGKLTWSI